MNEEYNTDQIQVLEGLEAVQKRPGMYIGSTPSQGLYRPVYEIVGNSINETLAGYCGETETIAHRDNPVMIKDSRRGIPVNIQKKMGLPAIEVVFTVLHTGRKFDGGGHKVLGGLHGAGAPAVNALSTWLEVKICHSGEYYEKEPARDKMTTPLHAVKEMSTELHGTEVRFLSDPEIFETTIYGYEALHVRLRGAALLTKNLKITLNDEYNDGRKDCFHFEGGIRESMQYLNRGREVFCEQTIDCEDKREGVIVGVTIQYNDGFNEDMFAFVNNINMLGSDTHLTGFESATTKTSNGCARNRKLLKNNEENPGGEDSQEGLTVIISVKVENPQFEGQARRKLGDSGVAGMISSVLSEQLAYFLEQDPTVVKQTCNRAILVQRVHATVREARDLTRGKSAPGGVALPGRLADYSNENPEECEIFTVEGNSAGGPARTARDRKTQAILPLHRKILNAKETRMGRVYSNAEIRAIVTASDVSIREDFDLVELRYHKTVIITDVDVDGVHITALMLVFIYRFIPELIQEDYACLTQPPLYKLEEGRRIQYVYSDGELNQILQEVGRDGSNKIQRYKGLGEIGVEQPWEVTMDPEQRVLLRVSMDEDARLELEPTFTTLMGDQTEPRREFIENNVKYVKNPDI